MSKSGVKEFAYQLFLANLDKRAMHLDPAGQKKRDTAFRKSVVFGIIEQFPELNLSISSASGKYNDALKMAKAEHPELVVNLGRPPEKNNGGPRKSVSSITTAPAFSLNNALNAFMRPVIAEELNDVDDELQTESDVAAHTDEGE